MPKLAFVSDEVLYEAVGHLLAVARDAKAKASKNLGRNVIDPFSLLFQMAGFGMNSEQWKRAEIGRQAEKTLQNHVGAFHQTILGSVKGWVNHGVGSIIDIECSDRKIIAEIKNKHNTVSGGSLGGLYKTMQDQVMPKHSAYKGFTAYYVVIIPKKPERYDSPFTPSDKSVGEKCPANNLIRTIDGASFYALATGRDNALAELFSVLPDVIEAQCKASGYKFDDRQAIQNFFKSAFA